MILLLLTAGLRGGFLIADLMHFHHLQEDRDAYQEIAHQLATGEGFSHSVEEKPTAFRPPLYPILLAGIELSGTGLYGIAFFHLVLSTLTVYLAYLTAKNYLPEKYALCVLALLAVDPLLVQNTTLVMTETLFAFLFTLLIYLITSQMKKEDQAGSIRLESKFLIGIVFGLAALCRPTVWAFGILWLMGDLLQKIIFKKPIQFLSLPLLLGIVLIVSPWIVRNQLLFDKPIFTTTHGGYTLLLGNNPVFYEEVVNREWGTIWQYDSLTEWQLSLEKEMATEDPPVVTEVERDSWMYRKAFHEIRNQPADFLKACFLRLRRFWKFSPSGDSASGFPELILYGIGLFYIVIFVGMILGFFKIPKQNLSLWIPLILALAAFTGVHLFYWTNMRMRTPLLPIICVFCIRGIMPARTNSDE